MPKPPDKIEIVLVGPEAAMAERTEFEAMFQRSKRGNLWCTFGDQTLSVFRRSDGRFGWCIAGGEGPRFSPGAFDEECDAVGSLAGELEVGLW